VTGRQYFCSCWCISCYAHERSGTRPGKMTPVNPTTRIFHFDCESHRLMELDLHSLFVLLCTAVLIGYDQQFPPSPSHLGSYTRALLVNQGRQHRFVTPWLKRSKTFTVIFCSKIISISDLSNINFESSSKLLCKRRGSYKKAEVHWLSFV
jgi:hypothetical protein